MGETDDDELKELHKKEYVTLSKLYSSMLTHFVNPPSNDESLLKSHDSASIPEYDEQIGEGNVIYPCSAD